METGDHPARAGSDRTLHFDTTSKEVYPVLVLQRLLECKCLLFKWGWH